LTFDLLTQIVLKNVNKISLILLQIVFIEKGLILPEVQRERGIKDGQIYHLPEGLD